MKTKTKKRLVLLYGALCIALLIANLFLGFKEGWDWGASLRVFSNLCFIILAVAFYKPLPWSVSHRPSP